MSDTAEQTTNPTTADHATQRGALPLRSLQVIGIFGTPEARRALLRSPAGQIRQVGVGDQLRQGTVVAISDAAVTLHRGATTLMLHLPPLAEAAAAA